jgi:hypothetical protein
MRSVLFTIIGILAIGWALATLAPPHWVFGEIFLLAACLVVVRDYLIARDRALRIHGAGNSMPGGKNAWFAHSELDDIDGHSQAFHPWDLDQSAAKTRRIAAAAMLPAAHVVYAHKQSVEQIAHDMLMQAFRQAAQTHHPDHGGNPEDMRRVCAARDMILRAMDKP